jgi:hypothetical protein
VLISLLHRSLHTRAKTKDTVMEEGEGKREEAEQAMEHAMEPEKPGQ